jgi:hypothetical protein
MTPPILGSVMIIYAFWMRKTLVLLPCQAADSPAAAMRLCQPYLKLTNWSWNPQPCDSASAGCDC